MVLYFKPENSDESGQIIFMGRDKFENEDLIKWGWPEDIWFHVDKLSSAHVYVRVKKGQTIDDLTPETLEDCAQLVKANSIQGNKQDDIDVVYTPWDNLNKRPSMEVGQVGFKSDKAVKKIKVKTRKNDIVNRLNKTKVEEYPNLQGEREAYDEECKEERRAIYRKQQKEEKLAEAARKKEEEERSYDRIMGEENMTSNKANKGKSLAEIEDDFM